MNKLKNNFILNTIYSQYRLMVTAIQTVCDRFLSWFLPVSELHHRFWTYGDIHVQPVLEESHSYFLLSNDVRQRLPVARWCFLTHLCPTVSTINAKIIHCISISGSCGGHSLGGQCWHSYVEEILGNPETPAPRELKMQNTSLSPFYQSSSPNEHGSLTLTYMERVKEK
jgi:hypothetical protein